MPQSSHRDASAGVIAATSAFFAWGLWPLFLKPLHDVDTLQMCAWRAVLGCITAMLWLLWKRQPLAILHTLRQGPIALRLCVTSALLVVNWTVYVWAISHHQVVSSSLGYFINPLMNVLLGVLLLSERLHRIQWVAVIMVAGSVTWMALSTGQFPWVALALATSFSVYGLIRKTTPVEALPGSATETLLMSIPALAYLVTQYHQAAQHFSHSNVEWTMILLFGPLTILPSVWFAYGTRRIHYATVGMLQYLAPTMQFALGLWVFHEPLATQQLLCFAVIWCALALYAIDTWRKR